MVIVVGMGDRMSATNEGGQWLFRAIVWSVILSLTALLVLFALAYETAVGGGC